MSFARHVVTMWKSISTLRNKRACAEFKNFEALDLPRCINCIVVVNLLCKCALATPVTECAPPARRPLSRNGSHTIAVRNGRKTAIETDLLSRKAAISFCLSEFMLFYSFEISTPRARSPRRTKRADP